MIKRYIPEKYDLKSIDIHTIIHNVLGIVETSLIGRLIIIYAEPTPQQLQQIKSEFLEQVEIINEL